MIPLRIEKGWSFTLLHWWTATVLLASYLMASALVESCGAVVR